MRRLLWMTLLLATTLCAAPITIHDAYGGQNPGNAKNNGDVIGYLRSFDIESLSIANLGGGMIQLQILMNYGANGGDTTLSGITHPNFPTVHPGDVLISAGSAYWAIPLISHDNSMPSGLGMIAGNLYQVAGYLTAGSVLNHPTNGTYRPNQAVWGNSTGASRLSTDGTSSASGVGGAQIRVDLSFSTTDSLFLSALGTAGTMIQFSSATCGNDVLADTTVPEPATYALIAAGIGVLWMRRRKG